MEFLFKSSQRGDLHTEALLDVRAEHYATTWSEWEIGQKYNTKCSFFSDGVFLLLLLLFTAVIM